MENRYVVAKDFCGERYYLPVTVVGNTGVAGEQKHIVSTVNPDGVRIDSTDPGHVKVIWTWDRVPGVRVKWTAEDGVEHWSDIVNDGSKAPEFELPLPPRSRNISVSVSSIINCASGETVESDGISLEISLKPVNVEFEKVQKPSFFKKNKYTITLRAEAEPPCDLYVLIEEGRVPLDLINFKSYLTIPHSELSSASPKSFTVEYHRNDKSVPLYFRIIAANRGLPVVITPETQSV